MTKFLVALFLVLFCSIILFKCNNPVKTYLENRAKQRYAKTEIRTVEKLQYQYVHDTVIKERVVNGKTHYIVKTISGSKDELNFLQHKIDSLCNDAGIKQKQLDNLFSSQISVKGHDETFGSDEFGDSRMFVFDHGSLHAIVEVDSPLMEHATLDYFANISLNGALYWKRTWFLGKKHWEQQLYSNDTAIKISLLQSIKILKKK